MSFFCFSWIYLPGRFGQRQSFPFMAWQRQPHMPISGATPVRSTVPERGAPRLRFAPPLYAAALRRTCQSICLAAESCPGAHTAPAAQTPLAKNCKRGSYMGGYFPYCHPLMPPLAETLSRRTPLIISKPRRIVNHFLERLTVCNMFSGSLHFCTKKALLSEKFLFQGREHSLRVTTLKHLRHIQSRE